MPSKDYFKFQMNQLTEKYPLLKGTQDYHLFTFLCMKYYFYSEPTTPFDADIMKDFLTDGSNDGGIDAIFNDPQSDTNDIIVVQSKYYQGTQLKEGEIFEELDKIEETIKNIKNNKVSSYNEKVVTAFRKAQANMEEDGQIRVYFFTSYIPPSKKYVTSAYKKYSNKNYVSFSELNLYFNDDIETQIDVVDNGKILVENDALEIDDPNNYLAYENSIICNVSAKSLQNLRNRRGDSLLGLNLRYHVKGPIVDTGIKKTIAKDCDNFWYKNNGILVVCDSFEISGKKVQLSNFSLVNGGQTTTMIGKSDIEKDFYIQCKIIVVKGNSDESRHNFVNDIAEATNTQKPIKKSDLRANSYEQTYLHERLKKEGIFYISKKGQKVPKQYNMPYLYSSLEAVGKLGLAGVLLMPGSARSNSSRMYQDEYYYSIFGKDNVDPKFIKDLLKIDYYYEKYKKSECLKSLDPRCAQPMAGNGKTYTIACIAFLSKLFSEVFKYDVVLQRRDDTDSVKQILKSMNGVSGIIVNNVDNEEETILNIFRIISEEVLGYCFESALDKAEKENLSLAPSDYLKDDKNFYRDVIIRLYSRYNNSKEFKRDIDLLLKK